MDLMNQCDKCSSLLCYTKVRRMLCGCYLCGDCACVHARLSPIPASPFPASPFPASPPGSHSESLVTRGLDLSNVATRLKHRPAWRFRNARRSATAMDSITGE